MRTPTFHSADEIQSWACKEILRHGKDVAPRNSNTLEITGAHFTLCNPRARVVTLPSRGWSLPIAVGELCWNFRGAEDVASLAYYAPRWINFASESGEVRGSCYGKRIFKANGADLSQWDRLVRLLKVDPTTRRAVLTFTDSSQSLNSESVDEPCITSMQFLIRNCRLDAYVQMRSNDAIWGLPYDVFLFSALQEVLANEVGVALGVYHHQATSLHLYQRHFQLAEKVASDTSGLHLKLAPFGPQEDLERLTSYEQCVRGGESIASGSMPVTQTYLGFAKCVEMFSAKNRKGLFDGRFMKTWGANEMSNDLLQRTEHAA